MANDVVPMTEMFSSCHEVLCRELVLMHYAELTELALVNLNLTREAVDWNRQIEDVREKMLLVGQHDSFYIGDPFCLGGLRWWFGDAHQVRLLKPTEGVLIPGNVGSGIKGGYEALKRYEYMIKKTSASLGKRQRGCVRGLVVQAHVTDWFYKKWPEFYKLPDNAGKWQQPCSHDFKLCVEGQTYEIDVSGPHSDGHFGDPGGGKRKAHFHLLCEIDGQDIRWKSVVKGENFNKVILPDFEGMCPEHVIVWLNCKQAGLDYEAVKSYLQTTEAYLGEEEKEYSL